MSILTFESKNKLKRYELNNYKLLWFIVDFIDSENLKTKNQYKKIESILRNNLNIEILSQFLIEREEVYSIIEKCLYNEKIFNGDEELIDTIYFLIGLGQEKCIELLENKNRLSRLKCKDNFKYIVPELFDFEDRKNIEELINQELNKYDDSIDMLKKSFHLNQEYINQIEIKSQYFTNFFKDILNKREIKINKKEYDKNFEEFSDYYQPASDYLARIKNRERNDIRNQLIGYIYTNVIEEYINDFKYGKEKIDFSEFDKNYIEKYNDKKVVNIF